PPALPLGEALVHAQQVATEQGSLVAAGSGADFEHRRALVGRVAGEELQGEVALRQRELGRELMHLLRSHLPDLVIGIGEHLLEHVHLGPDAADLARGLGDRLDLGIILGEANELLGPEIGRRHRILKLIPPRLDGGDPVRRDGGHRSGPPLIDPNSFASGACTRSIRLRESTSPSPRRRRINLSRPWVPYVSDSPSRMNSTAVALALLANSTRRFAFPLKAMSARTSAFRSIAKAFRASDSSSGSSGTT